MPCLDLQALGQALAVWQEAVAAVRLVQALLLLTLLDVAAALLCLSQAFRMIQRRTQY
jgi:hypothetical protein